MINLSKPNPELRNGFKDKKRMAAIHELPCTICFASDIKQITRTVAHHKIGNGLGLKASDKLTMAICEDHHTGKNGVHTISLKKWEEKFFSQTELIEFTNKMLEDL